jgi:GMP synthase-like glutamine amidotransferase
VSATGSSRIRPIRIGLLECDHVDERYRAIAGDYDDMFAALLSPVAPDAILVRYDAVAGVLPDAPDECDAWLATGSRYSAYDDRPWIDDLCAFVRDVHDDGVPFVGVCFGHQVLARALGGEVVKAPSGWGVGGHRLNLAAHEPWMNPPVESCSLLFMHQDQVVRLPQEGIALAFTEHCEVAMFRVGRSMLGIQPHPEFDAPYVDALLVAREKHIGVEKTAVARASLATPPDNGLMAQWIARFLGG